MIRPSIFLFLVILCSCQLTEKKKPRTNETSSNVEALKLPELETKKKDKSSLKFTVIGTKTFQLGDYHLPVVELGFNEAPWDYILFSACQQDTSKLCIDGKGVGKEILVPLLDKGTYKVELKACLELDTTVCGPTVRTFARMERSLPSEIATYIMENFAIAQDTEKLVADLKIKTKKYLDSPNPAKNPEEEKLDEMLAYFLQVNDVAIARLYLSDAYLGTKAKYIEEKQKKQTTSSTETESERPPFPEVKVKNESDSEDNNVIQDYWNRERKYGMVLIVLGISLPYVYGTAAYMLAPFAFGAAGGMVAAPISGFKGAKRVSGKIYSYTKSKVVRGFVSIIATFIGISTGISVVASGFDKLMLTDLNKRQKLLHEFDLATIQLEKLRDRNELILRKLKLK
ncbi:MAG: hypothetical protein AB8G05_04375 [Oligoflexales bacterium]